MSPKSVFLTGSSADCTILTIANSSLTSSVSQCIVKSKNSRQMECSIVPSFKFNLSYIFDDQEKKVRENLFGHQFPIVNNSPQISESEICASAISRTFSVQTVPLLLSFLTWLLRQERLLMASSRLSCFSYVMSRQLVLAIKHVQATEEWLVSKFKEYGNDCIFHLHECQCWCQPECYPASTVAADGPL